jgi:hypothetical protein
MTWNINLQIKDGRVDPDSLRVVGTPPDGPININGHQGDQGRGIALGAAGLNISGYSAAPEAVTNKSTEWDAELLARSAYAAYDTEVGGLNHQGKPMPAWQDLPDNIRKAWIKAATTAADQARG